MGKLRERYRSELRVQTLAEARELIKDEGYEGLTIRKLAQRMQCSPMALYTYFADKQALLTALAAEGLEELAKRHESAGRREREPLSALRKMMLDHIAWAEENPTDYRNFLLTPRPLENNTRQKLQEDSPVFRVLFKYVQRWLEAGALRGDAFAISTIVLTAVRGAAALLVTFPDFPVGSHRRYAEEVIATTLSGLQNRVVKAI